MNVPEPEKGHEEGQDEEGPEPVLLIRLDEADALVHLRSMVSYCFSAYFTTFLPRSLGRGEVEISSRATSAREVP